MDTKRLTVIIFAICLGTASASNEDDCGWTTSDCAAVAAGTTAAIAGAPVLVAGAGFGAGGIAAGSLAAKAMSAAAKYGVGGGAVETRQSVSAAGVGGTLVSGIAGAVGGKIVKHAEGKSGK